MLINAKPAQVEQPLEAVNMAERGQGLPQKTKFSELFASMFTVTDGKKTDKVMTDGLVQDGLIQDGLMQNNVNQLLPLALSENVEGATLPADFAASFDTDVDMSVDLPEMNLENLPGLVGLQGEALVTDAEEISKSVSLTDSNIMDVVTNALSKQDELDASVSLSSPLVESEEHIDTPVAVLESVDNELGSASVMPEESLVNSGVANLGAADSELAQEHAASQATVNSAQSQQAVSNQELLEAQKNISVGLDSGEQAVVHSSAAANVASVTSQPVSAATTTGQAFSNQSASVAQWSQSASDTNQTAGFSQSGAQGNSQNNPQQSFSNPQNAMSFQEQRAQNIQQQLTVKAADESVAKVEQKGDLLGVDLVTGEKRGQLPIGLQTISVPVRSSQWGQAMGQRVVFMANNQVQQAQITLNPEKLGPVQVKLHMDKDQQVHVTMNAQHLTTREAMENALPRLREMLEQSGINLASVDIGDHSNFAENKENELGQSGSLFSNGDGEVDSAEAPVHSTVVATDNIVDYYA
ncbi:MAG: flagellar hook-length control protein FliK [Thiomicrorhabdus sp.]|nr:flagellar hook-length control protein FliK [Thiomicrorhabdus sp.]